MAEKGTGYGAREKLRVTLDGNADAVEFCPAPSSSSFLAAATYTLHESHGSRPSIGTEPDENGADQPSSSRCGSLSLFAMSEEKLGLTQRIPTAGIFDIRWRPRSCYGDEEEDSPPLLAQASSDGTISLYRLQAKDGSSSMMLGEVGKKVAKEGSMCLSVDWDPHTGKDLAVSHSDGTLSLVAIREGSEMENCESSGNAHGFEAWTVSYDGWKHHILYSGADDCHFCGWDLRQGLASSPVFRDKGSTHQMGVCCIQTSPHEENVLVTGSYDEHIRVWDMRSLGKPLVDRSLGLGGGVWKLKWSPFDKRFIAAACMHNGFYIVKLEACDIDTVAEYKNHGSLAYGIDWYKAPDRRKWCREVEDSLDDPCSPKESLLASCSFYDRSLHLWQCYL